MFYKYVMSEEDKAEYNRLKKAYYLADEDDFKVNFIRFLDEMDEKERKDKRMWLWGF